MIFFALWKIVQGVNWKQIQDWRNFFIAKFNAGNRLTSARFFDRACSVFMQVEEPTRSDFHTCRCSIRLASCFLFCFFSVVRLCFLMFFFLFPGLFFLSFRRCFSGSSSHFPLAFFGYGFFGWLEIFFALLLGSFGLSA